MIKLIDLDHQQSQYDRPSMRKICGLVRYGRGCELGPNARGECPGRAQCVPFRKEDRWECTRTRASGGRCDGGPTPDGRCTHYVQCVPANNIRFIRSRVLMFSLIALFAAIMVVLASPLSESVVSPGPLTNVHAGIDSLECESCHQVDFQSVDLVLAAAVSPGSVHSGNQSCLSCHQLGAQADLAHGVSTQILGTQHSEEISCSVCHLEHKGAQADLTSISNARCDSCHAVPHDPFLSQHPPFENYVANATSMIGFDHPKHFGQYFLDEDNISTAPTNCRSCHTIADDDGKMGVKPFQEICSACHTKDVRSLRARDKGIAVINIPAMDIETLSSRGLDIGPWPEEIDNPYLTPMFAALLSQNDEIRGLVSRINDGDIDLMDLSEATPDDLVRVRQLAWSIKDFLYRLETEGHAHMVQQMSSLSATPLADEGALIASLPLDLVANVTRIWFGDVASQISTWRSGGQVPTTAREVDIEGLVSTRIEQMELGGWYSEEYRVAYRPAGHADAFLQAWLDVSDNLGQQTMHPEFSFVYSMLTSRSTPGACVKCHELKTELSDGIHWESSELPDTDFTNFNHKVHFLVVGDEGCLTCHATSTGGGSFMPIQKSSCEGCHVESGAGDNCLTCHDYHLGGFETVLPNTRVGQLLETPES